MLLQLLLLLLLLLLLVPSRFGSTKATAKPKACRLGGRSSCICLLRKVSGMCTGTFQCVCVCAPLGSVAGLVRLRVVCSCTL